MSLAESTPLESAVEPNQTARPRIPELIQRADLVPATKRGILAVIAAIGWALWIYLLLPLGALLAWWFGYQRLDLFVLADPQKTMATLQIYSIIILAGGLLFIFWAMYNWIRFHGKDRRSTPTSVDAERIGHSFHVPGEWVMRAQNSPRLVFHFSADGEITAIANDEPDKKPTVGSATGQSEVGGT